MIVFQTFSPPGSAFTVQLPIRPLVLLDRSPPAGRLYAGIRESESKD